MPEYGQFIGGEWREPAADRLIPVLDKYGESVIARVGEASATEVAEAVAAAEAAFESSPLDLDDRFRILATASESVRNEAEELAHTLVREVGKTIREARAEVVNAATALQNAAEEAKRVKGEMVPLAAEGGSGGPLAFTLRVPSGPTCAITPFNSPLNIVAHKVGSSIAAGNSVVVKPSEHTPLTTARFAEILAEAGLPRGVLNVVFGGPAIGAQLCNDQRFARYSFTGGHEAGRKVAAAVGVRPLTLELGPAGPTFVHHDADLELAAKRSAAAAFGIAGQVCTSVQRLYVNERVFDDFMALLLDVVGALRLGDPMDEETDVGPVMTEAAAERAEGWVADAVAGGARVELGGRRERRMFEPTVLTGTTPDMDVFRHEAFAPILCVVPYSEMLPAVKADNKVSHGGLQAGIFTTDLATAFAFARSVRAGGVMINDTSRFRVAHMPFGGVGRAGYGKEGPEFAIRELTDSRTVVLHL